MSLYLGRTLVAGGGARVIICKSRQDYIRQFEARGASGVCDFYYVPPIDEQVDLRGIKISLV